MCVCVCVCVCSCVVYVCVRDLLIKGVESGGEETSASSELKDLEFKLLHDLTKLQVSKSSDSSALEHELCG